MEEEIENKVIRSTKVEKALELEYDLGNLMAFDPNEVSVSSLKANPEAYIESLSRDNAQLLVNNIWTLPFERVDGIVTVKIPPPKYLLPREKPVPKPKPLTKWETYAKEKGVQKRKKTKLVWDELVNEWVPRYGYKRAAVEHEKDWVLEVPKNVDPFEDQFEKKSELKSERVAKNELQRLKNIARARKVQVPTAGFAPKEQLWNKGELNEAANVAKQATASLGKFQKKISKEKPVKNTGKKRKFDPLVQRDDAEKTRNLGVLDRIINKKPMLNLEKSISTRKPKSDNAAAFDEDGGSGRPGRKGGRGMKRRNQQKRGSVKQGSFKKGRAAPKSKPKKKQH